MATEAVQPLKIVKHASPTKSPRPLSELGPTTQRRNSPSYNQSTRKMLLHHDSSPFDSSPFQARSPRTFWEDRATLSPPINSENDPERSCSPEVSKRRSSIENLKRASRVKNSSMYAKETKQNYDPSSSPVIERPLKNSPWGGQLQSNVFARYDSLRKENKPLSSPERPQSSRSESKNDMPVIISPSKIPAPSPAPEAASETAASPRKDQPSPMRSSLVANSRYANSPPVFDPDSGAWSDEEDEIRASTPRGQPRHAKSVTFQNSPPEINTYEEQTPEPSSNASGSREGSYESFEDDQDDSFDAVDSAADEDSFDASLEDADKTPVVLPGDWKHMSPDNVNTDLVDEYDDVFDDHGRDSPAPSATPMKGQRPDAFRTDSGASDGSDFRPLPPIPGFASSPRRGREGSPRGLAMAAERASSLQRSLPSPPRAASVSKDEILRMREATMSLEDRMGLMALQESLAEVQKNQTGTGLGLGLAPAADLGEEKNDDAQSDEGQDDRDYLGDLADFDVAPSISRESILRNVQSNRFDDFTENDFNEDDSAYDSPERDYAHLDPDVAIPSRENSTQFAEEDAAVIKQEEESFIDLDAIPAMHAFGEEQYERQSSVIRHQVQKDEDDDSRYDDESRYDEESHYDEESQYDEESRYSSPMTLGDDQGDLPEDEGTPRASVTPVPDEEAFSTPLEETTTDKAKHMSLPLLGNFMGTSDYGLGLESYMTPSPPATGEEDRPSSAPDMHELPTSVMNPPEMFKPSDSVQEQRPHTGSFDSASAYSGRDSFDSVIHDSLTEDRSPAEEEPIIPERRATIKTQGQLKARPSGTPADLQAMALQRRQVSVEVPPIPDKYRSTSLTESEATETQSMISEESVDGVASDVDDCSEGTQVDSLVDDDSKNRRQSRKQLKLDLDLPATSLEASSGLGLMEEFDRVMESQKKGYLMRQNTKVVVASNRNFSDDSVPPKSPAMSPPMSPPMSPSMGSSTTPRASRSAGNSPRKSSAGEKWLTAEPWNGKTRRKSTRKSSGRRSNIGVAPAPPLPGQESALGTVNEYMTTDETDEGAERGRLFVKVVGVKDLDLPLPRNDRLYFQLTLDNGLHCVTTANLELGKSALIGQEFELVVLTDLEFQLTLTTKLPPAPRPQQIAPAPVPSSPTKSTKSGSVFSRLLSSPKKRAERERKEREEAELAERRQREEAERRQQRVSVKPTQWDLMRELVDAKTGSFARAYVNLKSHESQCFGRPLTVDVPCFNEWALEKDANVVSSVRSKRNNGNLAFGRADGAVRRPPYTVGNLELQLLYIPKPKIASDDDMPKSMSSAIREMKAAEQVKEASWEGCLSQQGGDCPYWRRRFFKLQGTKLTAYHEATMQPRATINLSKAAKLIDDRSALVADPNGGNPSSRTRRKSAFAEDDEGYQFVEDGFRIRFANGETIDFYADNVAQKDAWMKALSQSVGKAAPSKQAKWTDVVLSKERAAAKVAGSSNGDRKDSAASDETNASSTRSAPNSPLKRAPSARPAVPPKVGGSTPPMSPRTGHRQRDQVKSMIF